MKVCYIPYFNNELNDVAFSEKFKYRWTNILKDKLEQNGHEIHTYDILPLEEADAILSFDNVYFQNNKFFKYLLKCKKLGMTSHIDYEPPSANCRIHDDAGLLKLSNLFKSIITYNDNVVNGQTIVKGNIGDFFSTEQNYDNNFKNKKLVTIIANYRVDLMLFGQYPNELYSKRKEAVNYFQNKCPDEFDYYGNYWPKEMKKCYCGPVKREDKFKVLSNYKFIISYDSLTHQNGYISEKLFDCFNAKIVPVYWGADNVTDYVPKDCFIDKRDFNTYDELYDYLENMSEKTYLKYIKAIEKYLQSKKYKEYFSSQASANVIYNELIKEPRKLNYLKAQKIINEFEHLRTTDIRYNYTNNYYDYHFPKVAKINTYKYKNVDNKSIVIFPIEFYTSSKYNIELLYRNSEGKYTKLETKKKILKEVYNGAKYETKISTLDIHESKYLRVYVHNLDNDEYSFLKLELMFPFDMFNQEYGVFFGKDSFFIEGYEKTVLKKAHNSLLISIKDKFLLILRKCHIYYISIVCFRLIRLPFLFIKRFIDCFRV